MPIYLPFLSSSPHIRVTSDLIEVRPSATLRLRNLGAGDATILVDSKAKRVVVRRRSFWFFNHRRIVPFHAIRHVTYQHAGQGEAIGYVTGESAIAERFEIGLRLKTGELVPLIEIDGDAPQIHEVSTLGHRAYERLEEALDLAGTQQEIHCALSSCSRRVSESPLGPKRHPA